MTMEFGSLSKATVGEVATTAAKEGGSVIVGLLGAGILGKQIEKYAKPGVVATSTITDKAIAWVANNAPKVGVWYLLKKEGTRLGGLEKDIEKGIVASVVLDTIVRAGNDFAPKSLLTIAGFDVLSGEKVSNMTNTNPQLQAATQQLIQENSVLRGQLNQALGKLASTPAYAAPPEPHDTRFGAMQSTPEAENRRKTFGSMESPIVDERHTRFGSMKAKMNFAGEEQSLASAFGML